MPRLQCFGGAIHNLLVWSVWQFLSSFSNQLGTGSNGSRQILLQSLTRPDLGLTILHLDSKGLLIGGDESWTPGDTPIIRPLVLRGKSELGIIVMWLPTIKWPHPTKQSTPTKTRTNKRLLDGKLVNKKPMKKTHDISLSTTCHFWLPLRCQALRGSTTSSCWPRIATASCFSFQGTWTRCRARSGSRFGDRGTTFTTEGWWIVGIWSCWWKWSSRYWKSECLYAFTNWWWSNWTCFRWGINGPRATWRPSATCHLRGRYWTISWSKDIQVSCSHGLQEIQLHATRWGYRKTRQ